MPQRLILSTCCLGLALAFAFALGPGAWVNRADAQAAKPRLERYEGFTEPSRSLVVESYLDGVLETLHVKAGDRFKQGDQLVRLDDGMQALAVEVATLRAESVAEIKIAEARVTEAEVELESQEALAKQGSATARDVRRAKASLDVSKAELEFAKENKRQAAKQLQIERERLALYTIRAPFDGEVLALATQEGTEEGAALQQNDRIMHIAQMDPIVAKISLPQSIVSTLRVDKNYSLRIGQVNNVTQAKLKRVASQADRGSQLIEVTFEIANPQGKLRSGVRCNLLGVEPVDGLSKR